MTSSRFFHTEITRNDKPYLAEALFNDTQGSIVVSGAPLVAVIAKAYGVPEYRVVDGPEWIHTPHLYDIEAVPPPAFVNSNEGVMLQNLLKDQFGLEVSKATRDIPALALALEGGNSRLEPVTGSTETGLKMKYLSTPDSSSLSGTFTLDELAEAASKSMRQPVINQTGLQGRYRFNADITATPMTMPVGRMEAFIKLVIETSGLRAEQKVLPMAVIVVEKIEHPKVASSAN